jgi:hypothetical protein
MSEAGKGIKHHLGSSEAFKAGWDRIFKKPKPCKHLRNCTNIYYCYLDDNPCNKLVVKDCKEYETN